MPRATMHVAHGTEPDIIICMVTTNALDSFKCSFQKIYTLPTISIKEIDAVRVL